MTNDRDLWTDPKTGRLFNPRQILGAIPGTTDRPPFYDPSAWPEIRARMAEKGFWSLYEGKHIEQFLIDIKPIDRWVSLGACQRKYGKPPDPAPKLVFRDIASNTNERACIAAVLPERSCAGNTLAAIQLGGVATEIAATILNSFPADFAVRLRTAATHLNFTYMTRLCVPKGLEPLERVGVPTISVQEMRKQHLGQIPDMWNFVWLANRAVAEAYGLGPDDFEYILSTFPVFARKRPEFYAYLQARVREWKEEVEDTGRKSAIYPVAEPIDLPKAAEKEESYSSKLEESDM